MTAAVIDIGSNSIKVLVAQRRADGGLRSLLQHTLDARISAGIGRAHPRLSEEGMTRGLAAITDLLARVAPFTPDRTVIVATSAVREAENGAEFRARVLATTGCAIRILSGDEEANLIGRGLTCDPSLTTWLDFHVFDLGGGSLECLTFRARRVVQTASLPLGCVRLTEKFVSDSAAPLPPSNRDAIATHTREVLAKSGFHFSLLSDHPAVFAGGSMTTIRAVLAAQQGRRLTDAPALVSLPAIRGLLDLLAPLTLAQRREVPGLPAARADVIPAALVTILTLAGTAGLSACQHSLYNLRWGLADETLAV